MNRKRELLIAKTKKIVLLGVLSALYFILSSYFTIRLENIHISIAAVPVYLTTLLVGCGGACAVSLIGEFFNQLFLYGLTATTVLWLIPGIIRAFMFSIIYQTFGDKHLYDAGLVAGLCMTITNTAVMYADAAIYGYSSAYILIQLPYRIVISLICSFCSIYIISHLKGRIKYGKIEL